MNTLLRRFSLLNSAPAHNGHPAGGTTNSDSLATSAAAYVGRRVRAGMDDLTQVLQDTFRADGRNQPVGRARVRRWHRLVARAMEEFNDALEVLGDIAAPAHTNTARHGNGNSPAIANGNGASNGANTNANTPSPSLNAAGNQS